MALLLLLLLLLSVSWAAQKGVLLCQAACLQEEARLPCC